VDMMSGTPIYDIKPYLSYTDSHPEAVCGFADKVYDHSLEVVFPKNLLDRIPEEKQSALIELLEQDIRPGYKRTQMDEERIYGVSYAGFNVCFKVKEDVLTVVGVD
ncbi:MAG: tRNA (N6-threonylcarbamoyladenosine(37)-N6)-methyltransferase TrmO, partial [Lachnospiraceae bacterium]